MVFIPNKPQPTDQLSVSQGDILNNFGILGAIAGNTNPSSSSINATSGFNWLYLPPQGNIPPAASSFAAGNIGLYSANNPNTAINELYVNKTNQATVVQIPLTASILSVTSAPGNNSSGWTYLPSGILVKWGQAFIQSLAGPIVQTVNYPVAANIPAFNQVFSIQITSTTTNVVDPNTYVTLKANTITNTSFQAIATLRASSGTYANTNIQYLAIGY